MTIKSTPKLFSVLFICFFFILTPEGAQSQTLRSLGRKIERKIEEKTSRRAEKKLDETIDKALDKAEESIDNSENRPQKAERRAQAPSGDQSQPMSAIFGNADTKPLKAQYNFLLGIKYEMKEEGKKRGTPDMTMWISEDDYIGMTSDAQKSAFSIMDGGQMVVFMENNKSYMALGGIGSALANAAVEESEKDDQAYSFNKVGTETILGYKCDIYEMKSQDNEARVWLSDELGVKTGGMMKSFGALMQQSKKNMPDMSKASGMMLKMESVDLSRKEKITMEAKEVYKESRKIVSADYKSLGM